MAKLIIAGLVMLAAVIALPAGFSYVTNIENYELTLSAHAAEYTGKEIEPEVTLTNGLFTLEEGEDFTVDYDDNQDVGEATVEVKGKSAYRGSNETSFSIEKADQKIEGDNSITANIADEIDMGQTAETDMTYKSSDESVLQIDEEGNVTAFAAGKVTVEVIAEESESYNAAAKNVTVEITETEAQAAIRGALEWAREKAADDSYTYGRGRCPVCHGGSKVYDCIAFMTAAYWHGGKVEMMERWCWNHNYIDVIKKSMSSSRVWKNLGNVKEEDLQPGDVLFYYRTGRGRNGSGWFHVEIYNGDGQVVGAHTFSGGRCISVEPFTRYFRSYSEVYRYVGDEEE